MSNMVVMFRLENNNTWLSTFVESGNFKIKVKSDVLQVKYFTIPISQSWSMTMDLIYLIDITIHFYIKYNTFQSHQIPINMCATNGHHDSDQFTCLSL